jgi:hypothetical protein
VTARYSLRSGPRGTLLLVSRPRKRIGFALAFLLLGGAALVGFDPARDLSAGRAPFTVIAFALTAGCLAGALATRTTTVDPGTRSLGTEQRIAGLRVGAESIDVAEGSELRIARPGGEHGPYQLELRRAEGTRVLDASSWVSELEPAGRKIAKALAIPFSAPPPHDSGIAGRRTGVLR